MINSNYIKNADKLLIIQTAFIGDTALSLFLAQAIKNLNPDCSIYYLTTPVSAEFVAKAECVSKVFTLDKRGTEKKLSACAAKAAEINSEIGEIDIVVSLHRSARTSLLVSKLKATLKAGFSNSAFAGVYNLKIKYYPCLHEVARNAEFLNGLSYGKKVDFYPEVFFKKMEKPIEAIPKDKKYCVVAPGSVWETKRWKSEYFKELVEMLAAKGIVSVITGSKSECEVADLVASGSKSAINLAGKITLSESIELMRNAEFVVCNDSAPTHLAALAGSARVLTIYGATSPMFGFYPIGKKAGYIESDELKCHPCEIHGSRRCPLNLREPLCISSITPARVIKLLDLD